VQIGMAAQYFEECKARKAGRQICNLRDILASPPADWSMERKQEYFAWAKKVN